MGDRTYTRETAYAILKEYTGNESLIRHALAVEAVMLHFARLLGAEDTEKWAITGLLHDFAYERYPDEHCTIAGSILLQRSWPQEYIRAVQSHGWKICSDVEPVSLMEKVLYTIDELTGLVAAAALVRPSKSVLDLEVKSVMKKWNQKNFAAGVDRQVIEEGAAMLDMSLEHITRETINGMRKAAEEIGLKGNPPD